MGMVVRTNTMALNAYRQLGMNNNSVAKSLEKLSSGFRINRAGDDAAGLAISEKMKAQITGLETASSNAQDGISLIQTAEGALTEVHSMLNRMVELATKSANGTYQNEVDREAIQAEVDALNEEIDRISQSTNFNGINLLDGSMSKANEEAFTISDGQNAVKAADIDDLSTNLPTKATSPDAVTAYHTQMAAVSQSNPEFTVDLGDLKLEGASDTADAALKLNIAGQEFNLTITNTGTKISATASDIASAIIGAISGTGADTFTGAAMVTGADGSNYVKLNDMFFTVSAVASETGSTALKFTFAGITNDGSGWVTTGMTETMANSFNAAIGSHVTFAAATGSTVTKSVDHAPINVKEAVVESAGQRAGMEFALGTNVMQDGYELTIENKTFVFKTLAGDKSVVDTTAAAAAGKVVIDVSAFSGDSEQLKQAAIQMAVTANNTDNFQIGYSSKDGKIHIDQLVTSATNTANAGKFDTYEKLANLFSAKSAAIPAQTDISVKANKIKHGDRLTIDGTVFTFTTQTTGAKNEILIDETNNAATLKNFEDAIKAAGYTLDKKTSSAGATGDYVIYGKDVNGKAAVNAPSIRGGGLTLQIGDTGNIYNMMSVNVDDMSTKGLGVNDLDVSNADAARNAINVVKDAINKVSTNRANMGALQNRLEHTINNLDVAVENLSAANSRIRDTDMAKEMMNYTKMNVLVQSAQAMLAQANQQPQSVLQLLQ